jgi:hypothetical protein
MAYDILMRRQGYTLRPADELAEDQMLTLPDMVMVSVRKPRSVPMHRMYFGILGRMIKAGAPGDVDALHKATKIKTGLVKFATMPDGEFMAFPDSTAFDAMDQDAFNRWFPKAVEFWKASRLWSYVPADLRSKIGEPQQRAA